MKTYRVVIEFPFADMTEWREGNALVGRAFGSCDGAGSGFGFRDMEWCGLALDRAKRMCRKAKSLDVRGIKAKYEEELAL